MDGVLLPFLIEDGAQIYVAKSKKVTKFVKFKHSTFFGKLFKKLSIWNNPELEG